MEENEIVDGTQKANLESWLNAFRNQFGYLPQTMSDFIKFVQANHSSGQIARHDPERMARAQRAGKIINEIGDSGINDLDISDRTFILELLIAVRDGKA